MNGCNTAITGFGSLLLKWLNVIKWERVSLDSAYYISGQRPIYYIMGDDPDYDPDAGSGLR